MCYRGERQDHTKGGIAITVKRFVHLHCVVLPEQQNLEPTAIELHGILVSLLKVSAYKPTQLELLSSDLEVVFSAHRMIVLAGDLNCKHPIGGANWRTETETASVGLLMHLR